MNDERLASKAAIYNRNSQVRLTFLGTGGSFGVPMLGCHCDVCTSTLPENKRLRTSALVEVGEAKLLMDTGPDLRSQCLRYGVEQVDAVLFTHDHMDHIAGLDDVRAFNIRQRSPLPCFGSEETLSAVRSRYEYVFSSIPAQGSRPRLELRRIDGPFDVGGERIYPLKIYHGSTTITGYRVGPLAYITDASRIPDETLGQLDGVKLLVLNALRQEPHPMHFSLDQAVEMARRIGAERTWLVHMGHEVEHVSTNKLLPSDIQLAYDGLVVDV